MRILSKKSAASTTRRFTYKQSESNPINVTITDNADEIEYTIETKSAIERTLLSSLDDNQMYWMLAILDEDN